MTDRESEDTGSPKTGMDPEIPMVERIGRFRVERLLGRGGMGEVYLGIDEGLKRAVAIKVLSDRLAHDASNVARFHREAQAAARVNHPNVTKIHELAEWDGRPYFVMEYVEGETLEDRLLERGRLDAKEALAIAEQAAQGLEAAAMVRLIHRDVKPSNIIIMADGMVKLTDFGLAKAIEEGSKLTRTDVVLGTPHYISPEQARGETGIDSRTDIYALGATLYHALAGKPPFDANTPMGVLVRHIHDPVPSLAVERPGLGSAIVELVHRCLAKDPGDRPQNYAELLTSLRAAMASLESSRVAEDGEGIDVRKRLRLAPTAMTPIPPSHLSSAPPIAAPIAAAGTGISIEEAVVLIVDDSSMTRKLLSLMVQQVGYVCFETGDSLMVKGFLRHRGVRIVLLDINMPERDGFEVLQDIKAFEEESGQSFPTVFVTGSKDAAVAMAASRAGAFALLHKPFSPEKLAEVLEQARKVLRPRGD